LRAQSKDLTTSHGLGWEILRKLRMTWGDGRSIPDDMGKASLRSG
jgi:hypothetical protein